jgi:hypothetical protein
VKWVKRSFCGATKNDRDGLARLCDNNRRNVAADSNQNGNLLADDCSGVLVPVDTVASSPYDKCHRPAPPSINTAKRQFRAWSLLTGWATKANWLANHVLVLHAEIYPSVKAALPDDIKDRGHVRAMWQWARDVDRENLLWREFCRPIEVEAGSKEDLAIELTEGWLLGCSPTITNQ